MDLGLEAAGIGKTIWQVEKDPYARRVLKRHWPDVQRFDDVKAVGATSLRRAHVVHGGFPCTDTSVSGQVVRDQAGLDGAHSSLWWEMLRICGELLPEFIIVENPPGLITNRNGMAECSVVFPISATMRGTTLCRVQPAVPRTLGLEFLSLHKESFPTLTARDYRSGKGWKPTGHTPQLPEVLGGLVNPTWAEWLGGFPIGWTECDALETP